MHLPTRDLFLISRSRSLFALFAGSSSQLLHTSGQPEIITCFETLFEEIYYVINDLNRSSILEENS